MRVKKSSMVPEYLVVGSHGKCKLFCFNNDERVDFRVYIPFFKDAYNRFFPNKFRQEDSSNSLALRGYINFAKLGLFFFCCGLFVSCFFFSSCCRTPSFFNNNHWAICLRLFWRWLVLAVAGWWRLIMQADTP